MKTRTLRFLQQNLQDNLYSKKKGNQWIHFRTADSKSLSKAVLPLNILLLLLPIRENMLLPNIRSCLYFSELLFQVILLQEGSSKEILAKKESWVKVLMIFGLLYPWRVSWQKIIYLTLYLRVLLVDLLFTSDPQFRKFDFYRKLARTISHYIVRAKSWMHLVGKGQFREVQTTELPNLTESYTARAILDYSQI